VTRRVHPKRAPRIFLGLIEVGGYYRHLAMGLEALGAQATYADLGAHPFAYGTPSSEWAIGFARAVRQRRVAATGAALVFWRAAYAMACLLLLAWAVPRHDAFVLGFRTSFFRLRDLPLLRRLGKRIIMVFHGSDARPPYMDGADMDPDAGRSIRDCAALARIKRREIRHLERHVDLVVAAPLYAHWFSRRVVGFHQVGIPQPPLSTYPDVVAEPTGPTLRVLHAPSNPFVKGSARIRQVVEGLAAAGIPIELVELRGVPNAAVMAELPYCHFVIDHLYSDIPMTSFVAEAARHGRPAVLGGYGWEALKELEPGSELPPVELCHPDDLEMAVRRLATDADHRRRLGAAARRFVETWAAERVAERFVEMLEGRVPPSWLLNLAGLRYVQGVGLAEPAARDIVRRLIETEGVTALQLDDRPALREAFTAFARAYD
jgi:hypothetical protein